jgi:hypothetical protein
MGEQMKEEMQPGVLSLHERISIANTQTQMTPTETSARLQAAWNYLL